MGLLLHQAVRTLRLMEYVETLPEIPEGNALSNDDTVNAKSLNAQDQETCCGCKLRKVRVSLELCPVQGLVGKGKKPNCTKPRSQTCKATDKYTCSSSLKSKGDLNYCRL